MAYTPRLSMGDIYTSPYYTTYNSWPTNNYDLSMPNCTAYAYGRWNEIAGVSSNPSWGFYGNGGDWYREGVNAGYLHTTMFAPQVGALISWTDSGAGHVAVIEQLIYDNDQNVIGCVTSNSFYRREYGPDQNTTGCAANFAWQDPTTGVQAGSLAGFPFFFTDTIYSSDPTQSASIRYGSFNGIIYHPDYPPETPPPTPGYLTPVMKLIASGTLTDSGSRKIYIERRKNLNGWF